jgi:regulator of protease activity HflC (stomatin/prohibitin superfamily)
MTIVETKERKQGRVKKLIKVLGTRTLDVAVVSLTVLFLMIYFWPDIVISVFPGQEGVVWRRFGWNPIGLTEGTVVHKTYGEGTHLVAPWNRFYIYNIRLQEDTHIYNVLSSDALHIQVSATIRYRPVRERLGYLHKEVGPEYKEVVVLPEVGAALREVIGRYRPEQLYRLQRKEIQNEVVRLSDSEARNRYVNIDDVLIRTITLPAIVRGAIERKLEEEQAMLRYDFTVGKEEREKERKRIEAEGIRQFQEIVTGGISDRYLTWKGIDATLEVAKSPNSKIVIIGGREGLPLILNTGER